MAAQDVTGPDQPPELVLLLRPAAADAASRPVEIDLWWNASPLGRYRLGDRTWQPVRLRHPLLDGSAGVLTLRVDRVWNPRRDAGGDDGRDLGVALVAPYWER